MSYRRRHRWFRRMALGLAFASVIFAGRVSVAAAKVDEGTSGSRYVAAGGWSGLVDMESGIPLSAGIPHGDEQFIDEQVMQVIPYLSHGLLTQEDADAAAAQAIHDPYLTDVFVRPGESLGGPDGEAIAFKNALDTQAKVAAGRIHDPYLTDVFVRPGESLGGPDGDSIAFANALQSSQQTVIPYLSHGILTEADAQAVAAQGIHDPYPTSSRQNDVLDGDELAFANAIVAAADSLHDPLTAEEQNGISQQAASEQYVPGVTDFPRAAEPAPLNRVERALEQGPQVIPYLSQGMTADDVAGVRPDDWADRFAHSDVASQPELVTSSGGSTIEWQEALTVGIGALALVLGLGLAFGYLRRPRLAGL